MSDHEPFPTDDAPSPSDPGRESKVRFGDDGSSRIAAMLSEVGSIREEKLNEILATLSEEKRQGMIASLGSVRSITRADIENALRSDSEWSAELSPWRRWIARRIVSITEYLLSRGKRS